MQWHCCNKPSELRKKNTNKNIKRTYYIIRRHKTASGIEFEKIKTNLSEDGKSLTFKTDRFSVYALAYEDTPINEKNPSTLDSIQLYMTLGSISVVALALIIMYSKKRALN